MKKLFLFFIFYFLGVSDDSLIELNSAKVCNKKIYISLATLSYHDPDSKYDYNDKHESFLKGFEYTFYKNISFGYLHAKNSWDTDSDLWTIKHRWNFNEYSGVSLQYGVITGYCWNFTSGIGNCNMTPAYSVAPLVLPTLYLRYKNLQIDVIGNIHAVLGFVSFRIDN